MDRKCHQVCPTDNLAMKDANILLVPETQDKDRLPHQGRAATRDNIPDMTLVKVLHIMTRVCTPTATLEWHLIMTLDNTPTSTLDEGRHHHLRQVGHRQASTRGSIQDLILAHILVWIPDNIQVATPLWEANRGHTQW